MDQSPLLSTERTHLGSSDAGAQRAQVLRTQATTEDAVDPPDLGAIGEEDQRRDDMDVQVVPAGIVPVAKIGDQQMGGVGCGSAGVLCLEATTIAAPVCAEEERAQ